MINRLIRRISGQFQAPDEENALLTLYRHRYEIALREERYDSALVFLDRMLEVRPRSLETRMTRARLFEILGNTRRAIDAYLRLLPFAELEDPAAASIVRTSLERLLGGHQNAAGASPGTISTELTEAAPGPVSQIEETGILETESQNPFPAGTIAQSSFVSKESPEDAAVFSPERRTA